MTFKTEADLCDAFIATLPEAWTPYPETASFDILLVHETGAQIGVEAKLKLNAKVLAQALPNLRFPVRDGPDFRAVLVPDANGDLMEIAGHLGVSVLVTSHVPSRNIYAGMRSKCRKYLTKPDLPTFGGQPPAYHYVEPWVDWCPEKRCRLPEYVPDVRAGCPAPQTLSHWKIGAMKVCIWVHHNGMIHRSDFAKLRLSPTSFTNGHTLKKGPARGWWVAGGEDLGERFKQQHPAIWEQIIADLPAWSKDLRKAVEIAQ